MRLPDGLLSRVRGACVAAALGACTIAPVPVAIVPEAPVAPVAPSIPAPVADPVAYDESSEASRLGAMDNALASAAGRRNRRISINEAAAARIAASRRVSGNPRYPGYGGYGGYGGPIRPACGRG